MQIAGAAVVPEAFPELEYAVFRRGRQRFNGRERLDETFVVGEALVDAGLLQEYFGEPDPVRVAGVPPWQIAGFAVEPGEQRAADR